MCSFKCCEHFLHNSSKFQRLANPVRGVAHHYGMDPPDHMFLLSNEKAMSYFLSWFKFYYLDIDFLLFSFGFVRPPPCPASISRPGYPRPDHGADIWPAQPSQLSSGRGGTLRHQTKNKTKYVLKHKYSQRDVGGGTPSARWKTKTKNTCD